MQALFDRIQETVSALRKKTGLAPEAAVILGTGLGKLADKIEKALEVPYDQVPHFPISTVESHKGRLIFGTLSGRRIVAMQGRFHFYEGYSLQEVVYPVRVLKALGAHTLIVSNACGGINPAFRPGDIMLITDHINLLGHTPLCGRNDSRLGPRFPDMFNAYNDKLLALAASVAKGANVPVQKGVYAVMSGPCLETAAEYRMLGRLGADAVGMSTVPEVIAAVHAGLKVLGVSVITDKCDPDTLKPVDINEIIATAGRAEPKMVKIIEGVLQNLPR
jgi:purine-nucleoside phosphorylase